MAREPKTQGGPVQEDHVTATGTVVSEPARVRGVVMRGSGGLSGQVELRNGGSGGTVKLTLPSAANDEVRPIPLPGTGIDFDTDVHATLTNLDFLAVLWQPL